MFDDKSPIYLQIAAQIKEQILHGELKEDEQVMSTNQYASFYRINPATAAKGFQQLTDDQILYKKRGIGMFVSPGARERIVSDRRERFFQEKVDAMLEEAAAIGIPWNELIDYMKKREGENSQ
ncbi:GntR family transcriptional regulator [Xylanibacillus composti]|uniref:GntR family transcriptional regulator n=1 Tax=Xylanibacillus composti TaxID=1572762 RepID=A0A8J4H628_9BACL|nr:GntR family transcriptional regulator [Xylanibacillus composti]MDT9724583.1 GntR family transcriptional regulator [Xylanibacillus composti]GIQ70257.1 GntR family transcriptional regulator [Xylanibacillus composti]